MLDSTKFGLTPNVEVKFLTPEEAAKVNASSGYNAVHKIGDRVRYELLKAGKVGPSSSPVAVTEEVKVAEVAPVIVQKQKPLKQKVAEVVKKEEEPVIEVPQNAAQEKAPE